MLFSMIIKVPFSELRFSDMMLEKNALELLRVTKAPLFLIFKSLTSMS